MQGVSSANAPSAYCHDHELALVAYQSACFNSSSIPGYLGFDGFNLTRPFTCGSNFVPPFQKPLAPIVTPSCPFFLEPSLDRQQNLLTPKSQTICSYSQAVCSTLQGHMLILLARSSAQSPEVHSAIPRGNASPGSISNCRPHKNAPSCASGATTFSSRAPAYVQSRPRGNPGLSKSLHEFSDAPQVPCCVSSCEIHCIRITCVGERMTCSKFI